MSSEPPVTISAAAAVYNLREHYGMIGQPENLQPTPRRPFELNLAHAVGHNDFGTWECLASVPIFQLEQTWNADSVIHATPPQWLGRLRLLGDIAQLMLCFATRGMRDPHGVSQQLKKLQHCISPEVARQLSRDDPWRRWSDDQGEDSGCYHSHLFTPYGFHFNWPLEDFLKQRAWAEECFFARASGKWPLRRLGFEARERYPEFSIRP